MTNDVVVGGKGGKSKKGGRENSLGNEVGRKTNPDQSPTLGKAVSRHRIDCCNPAPRMMQGTAVFFAEAHLLVLTNFILLKV